MILCAATLLHAGRGLKLHRMLKNDFIRENFCFKSLQFYHLQDVIIIIVCALETFHITIFTHNFEVHGKEKKHLGPTESDGFPVYLF